MAAHPNALRYYNELPPLGSYILSLQIENNPTADALAGLLSRYPLRRTGGASLTRYTLQQGTNGRKDSFWRLAVEMEHSDELNISYRWNPQPRVPAQPARQQNNAVGGAQANAVGGAQANAVPAAQVNVAPAAQAIVAPLVDTVTMPRQRILSMIRDLRILRRQAALMIEDFENELAGIRN